MIQFEVTLQSGAFTYDKRLLKATLRRGAQEVMRDAQALIRAKIGGGRLYRGSGGSSLYRGYKAGQYQASIPGNPPTSVTGTLARSFKLFPFRSGDGIAIRDVMFYGLFLEAGAQGGVGSGGGGSTRTTRKAPTAAEIKSGMGRIDRSGQRNAYKRNLRVAVVGTRVLLPRPFLSTALAANGNRIGDKLRDAAISGLGWKKAA
jgi:hypothetical protein